MYGYVRVSSKDQNEMRQLVTLRNMGLSGSMIYIDKLSGKDFERPQYKRLMKRLKKNDVLVVTSIDRLGRNYTEILEQWRFITKTKGADMVVVDMPLLDTRARGSDLTGIFIADLVLQILSYVAETERANIKKRQKEGIAAAKRRGVCFGSPKKAMPDNFFIYGELYAKGGISCRAAARFFGVAPQTFKRWYYEYAEISMVNYKNR